MSIRSDRWQPGTPEGIRTSDLPLRRRPLYPAELLVHTRILYPQNKLLSTNSCGFFAPSHIYCQVSFVQGVKNMKECDDYTVDLDDLIFDPEEYHESER